MQSEAHLHFASEMCIVYSQTQLENSTSLHIQFSKKLRLNIFEIVFVSFLTLYL